MFDISRWQGHENKTMRKGPRHVMSLIQPPLRIFLASNLIEFFDKQVHGLMSGLGAAFRVEGIRQVSTYRAKRHKCRSFGHPPSVASRD